MKAKAPKRAPPRHVVFYIEDWREWRKNPGLAAVMEYLESRALFCTVDRITRASTAKRGPKQIWSDEMALYAWLVIEQRRVAAGAKHIKPFIDQLFASPQRRKPLIVHVDGATGKKLTLRNPETARRIYARGKQLLSTNPLALFALRDHKLLSGLKK